MLSGAAAAGGIALINSIGNVGGYLGPYAIGALKEQTGGYAAGMVMLAAAVAGAGLLVRAHRFAGAALAACPATPRLWRARCPRRRAVERRPYPAELDAALKQRFGERHTTAQAALEAHGRGETMHQPFDPDAVVFATSAEEVAFIVKACAAPRRGGDPLRRRHLGRGQFRRARAAASASTCRGWTGSSASAPRTSTAPSSRA